MSTKTTLKRIALVVVSALGFGVMQTMSVSAATIGDRNVVTSVSFSNTQQQSADSIARVGVPVSFDLRVSTGSSASNAAAASSSAVADITAYVRFSAVPSGETVLGVGSNISPTLSVGAGSVLALTTGSYSITATQATSVTAPAKAVLLTAGSNSSIAGSVTRAKFAQVSFTPNAVGAYTVRGWVDVASTGATDGQLDGADRTSTRTVTVGGVPTTIVATLLNSNAAATSAITAGSGSYTNNGSVFQVSVKDAAGNLTALLPGESVTVSRASGSGTISDVSLTAGDFNKNGFAYVTVSGTGDQTGTFTFAGTGFTATSVTQSATGYGATSVAASVRFMQTSGVSSGSGATTGTSATAITGADTITFTTGKAVTMRVTAGSGGSTSRYVPIQIVDVSGDVTSDNAIDTTTGNQDGTGGTARLPNYSLAVAIDDTLGYGSVTLPTAALVAGDSIQVHVATTPGAGQGFVITLVAADLALNAASTLSPSAANVVTGGAITLTAQCLDVGLAPIPGCAVSWSVAGRNATTAPVQALADANGYSTYTLVDTSTSTTVLTSTVSALMTYGASTNTETATVTFAAGNAPAKVTVTTSPTLTVATTESSISTAATGPANGAVTLAFTVTDASGNVIVGTPVRFTVDATSGVEWKRTATDTADRTLAYTDSSGVATTYIAGWVAPKTVTVTATAGTATASTKVNFVPTAASARNVTITAANGLATANVKDRFGNPVKGATVSWSRVGTGYFGTGVSATTGTTDAAGNAEILFIGDGTVKAELDVATYTQCDDLVGFINTTATSGTGATLAPAGTCSATVAVTGSKDSATKAADSATAAADAAADAAAEAIDAANAATDAANLAAEAADAATVAAEEARDAADAATAAVEELATQVATLMAALKAQITTLANTVAKIAKKVKA